MNNFVQEAPFTVQIELAQGCNVSVPRSDGTKGLCEACGLNAIRKGPGDYNFMTVETATKVAAQLNRAGWNSQLLFAMHGEPSMNPYTVEIITVFRKYLPKAYMVMLTNGGGFIKTGRLHNIFKAGLNVLAFDDYEGAGLVGRVPFHEATVPIKHYPEDKTANPHHRTNKQYIVKIVDIKVATKGTHSKLNNHAGSGMPPNKDQQGKRCAKPFRELGVQWDGTIAGCCVDWRNDIEAGNVHDTDIEQIWQGPVYSAMRRILIKGDRDQIKLCSGCDHPSYRVGLLPDKFGKVKLQDWTEDDVATVEAARFNKKSVVTFFPRPWHKENQA